MERQYAERKFNGQPVQCAECHQQFLSYIMLIHQDNRLICSACSVADLQRLKNIKMPYKEFYYQIIRKLPLPDYKIAKACMQSVLTLRSKVDRLLGEIKKNIEQFQKDLSDFFQQTIIICQGYIDKVKNIQQSGINGWHKQPPKLIEQQKYIINIKQKQMIASKIQQSLKELQFKIPNIDQIKKQAGKNVNTIICSKVSITAALNIRGLLYQGTNDGRIIYQSNFQFKHHKAHDSLIRAFAHDGQFKLFSGSDDLSIKMWDLRSQQLECLKSFGSLAGTKSFHRQLALVDNGRYLASSRGQFDGYKIRVWDFNSDRQDDIKTLRGHQGYIRGMVVNDRNQIISVSEDRYLKIWDLKDSISVGEYFHGRKMHYVFVSNLHQLICIVDEDNRVLLLDQNSLSVVNALYVGKKIQLAAAETWIYVHALSYIYVYNWFLCQIQRIQLGTIYTSTNIVEMGSKLIITDAHGVLHEVYPNCFKNSTI